MPTLAEILDRAVLLATGVADDSSVSRLVDSDVTAQVIFPHAVRAVIRRMARKGENLENLARGVFVETQGALLASTSGEGDLPDAVLREYMRSHAYVVGDQFSSWIPYPDYGRYRYSNQIRYFSHRGGRFFYSRETAFRSRFLLGDGIDTIQNDETITEGGFFGASISVGDRVAIPGAMDAFAQSVAPPQTEMGARAIATVSVLIAQKESLGSGLSYGTVRSLTAVTTTQNDETVSCPGGDFSSVDVGRRLRVLNGSTVVIDAIIESVTNPTTVEMSGRASASVAGTATAEVQGYGVTLHIPAIPDLPTDITDDVQLSSRIVDDVIVAIAAVLRGQIPLPKLIEEGEPDEK